MSVSREDIERIEVVRGPASALYGQGQYNFLVGELNKVVTGVDAEWTRPRTGGTINGLNEGKDGVNEFVGAPVLGRIAILRATYSI
jgi:outer membrane receptor protein involved in Fe transport